jgi:hypothetical protein
MSYSIWDQKPELKILPLPFEMGYKLADDQQKRHDADVEDSYKLQNLIGNIKSASFDRSFKKQLDDEYAPEFEALTNKVVNNDPTAHNDLIKLKSKFYTDQRIKTLSYNADQEEAALKDKAALMKDQTYRDWNDPLHPEGSFLKERTTLTPFTYSGMRGYTHPHEDAAKVVAGITEETLKQSGESLEKDASGNLTGYKLGSGEVKGIIDNQRFKNIIESSIPQFFGTKGGESFVDELKNRYGISDPKEIKDAARKYLIQAAYKQLHVEGGGNSISTLPGYDYKEENVNPYDEYDETQGIQTKNITGIRSDIFDVIPKGTTYYTGKQLYRKDGEAYTTFPEQKTSNKDTYSDLSTLPPAQKAHVDNMMNGIATNPQYADIYSRYKANKMTDEDKAKVYPILKHLTEIANKPQIRNATLVNITDKNERRSINTLLGGSNDETITRKQFGAGRYINRKAYDLETGKVLDSRELALKIHNEGSPDDLITIGSKYDGPNPIAILTGNSRFANGVQITVGGKSYILEGATGYKNPELEVRRRKNEISTDVYKATLIPNVPNKVDFFGNEIKTVFIPNSNNPDSGVYKIMSVNGKTLDGEKSYYSAEELTQDLPNIIK